eukprot:9502492-Pyramimonas_sp.AAC.1
MGRAVAADARVLPVMRTGTRREVTWASMAARNEGMGINGHHDRFRAVAKLEPTQWGVQEHYQCCQFVRLLLLSD